MSAARFLVAATVVLIAVLCAPLAVVPGFNAADFIVMLAPIALALVVFGRRRKRADRSSRVLSDPQKWDEIAWALLPPKTPAGGDAPNVDAPNVETPSAGPSGREVRS